MEPDAAAVADVLDLDGKAVRVLEGDFRGVGCAGRASGTLIGGAPHPQAAFHAVLRQRLHDLLRVELLDAQAEVVPAAFSFAQGDELRPRAGRQDRDVAARLRSVVSEPEHPPVVPQRARHIGYRDRHVVQRARRERRLARLGRLGDAAQLAEGAGAAAVAGVLDLQQHAVRVVEHQLGRIRGVDHHRALGRGGPQVVAPALIGPGEYARLDAQLRELARNALGVEVLDVHAEVVADTARPTGPGRAQGHELRSRANGHDRQAAAGLARKDRQVEEALVEVQRTLQVRDADRDVVQVEDGKWMRPRLRADTGAGCQHRRDRQEIPPADL